MDKATHIFNKLASPTIERVIKAMGQRLGQYVPETEENLKAIEKLVPPHINLLRNLTLDQIDDIPGDHPSTESAKKLVDLFGTIFPNSSKAPEVKKHFTSVGNKATDAFKSMLRDANTPVGVDDVPNIPLLRSLYND